MSDPAEKLKVYLVGGAVRDRVMGVAAGQAGDRAGDRDWVVIGSSPQQMIGLNFTPVGSDFPVFLHPHSREEYALARTERKTSRGYHGFKFNTDPDVTLRQDLSRRDFSMNAMAMDDQGQIIDPFGGQDDIAAKQIKHVSAAFAEDPVRILRLARFSARFKDQGFAPAESTLQYCQKMVDSGEVEALVAERVWQECYRVLSGNHMSVFIEVLRECGALKVIFPEIDALFGVPQVPKYHPEIDTGLHILLCLDAVDKLTDNAAVKFAVLTHDLGKALTPEDELPRHRGHELRGVEPVLALCKRLGVPTEFREFAVKVCQYHLHYHRLAELRATTVLRMLEALDSFRKPERVADFCNSCLADQRGRTGLENRPDICSQKLIAMHRAALEINGGDIAKRLATKQDSNAKRSLGETINAEIRRQRVQAIAAYQAVNSG